MPLLIPTLGEDQLLKFQLGVETPGDQRLRLYVNDYTPVDGSVLGDFTQMSTHGYTEKVLTKTLWNVAQVVGKAEGTYTEQIWTFTAAALVTVYGYYIVDTTTSIALWAERFTTPKPIQFAGDVIRFTPRITYSKEV